MLNEIILELCDVNESINSEVIGKVIWKLGQVQNEIFNGNVKLSGHIMLGVVLYYGLRFYFNKEIHRIIKKIG